MKKLFLILAVMLLIPTLAFALSLTITADVTSGTNLSQGDVLQCHGYSFQLNDNPYDVCINKGKLATLAFGQLRTNLKNPDGTDSTGAGCFYAPDFFIVYLSPDAWGGKGYELRQAAVTTFSTAIANSVIMSPVYSKDDKFSTTGPAQGLLDQPNEQEGVKVLAKNGGLVLKSKRARIVRAQYSIPPIPADGGNWGVTGWQPINMTTTTAGRYESGNIVISITEWQ